MTKEIKTREEHFIEFTEKELVALNWHPGDKLSWQITDEGVLLKKCTEIPIELNDFSKDELIEIIQASSARGLTFEEFIEETLKNAVSEHKEEIKEEQPYHLEDFDITSKEYHEILKSGLFWKKFPNATGSWKIDNAAYERYLDKLEHQNSISSCYTEPLPMREWLEFAAPCEFEGLALDHEWREDKRADSESF